MPAQFKTSPSDKLTSTITTYKPIESVRGPSTKFKQPLHRSISTTKNHSTIETACPHAYSLSDVQSRLVSAPKSELLSAIQFLIKFAPKRRIPSLSRNHTTVGNNGCEAKLALRPSYLSQEKLSVEITGGYH